MWLLLAFIAVPMIEIALFIQVGGAIGLGWTLAIVLATAILGTMMVRSQGTLVMGRIRQSLSDFSDPSEPLAEGAMILFSGALLLTPGFFTDAVGFALLVPAVRRAAFAWAKRRIRVESFSTGPGPGRTRPGGPGDVIDADFTEVDPDNRTTHRPSNWTRH